MYDRVPPRVRADLPDPPIDPEEGILLASGTLDEGLSAEGFVTGAVDVRVFTLAEDENGIITIRVRTITAR